MSLRQEGIVETVDIWRNKKKPNQIGFSLHFPWDQKEIKPKT